MRRSEVSALQLEPSREPASFAEAPAALVTHGLAGTRIAIVGGDDLYLRLPFFQRLQKLGVVLTAVGTGSGEPFERSGIPFVRYRMKRTVSPLADFRTLCQLRRILSGIRPTIVHAFDTKPGIYAIWAAEAAGVPIRIRTITGRGSVYVSQSLPNRVVGLALGWMHRLAARTADVTAFYNQEDLNFAIARRLVPRDKAVLVPGSGIDLDEFLSRVPSPAVRGELRQKLAAAGEPVVMMISRLLREKGVLEYLQAARIVRRQLPSTRFYLVGGIEPAGRATLSEEEIRSFAADVVWLGRREDVPALLSLADLVVLPTYYGEGIPRVILEAGACRRAVVATRVPGCTDVIHSGRNGWLVRPRDPQDLAGAIFTLVTDEALRQRLGDNLYADVSTKFTLDQIFALWVSIYQGCLEKRTKCRETVFRADHCCAFPD